MATAINLVLILLSLPAHTCLALQDGYAIMQFRSHTWNTAALNCKTVINRHTISDTPGFMFSLRH